MSQQTEAQQSAKAVCISAYAEAGFTLFPLNGKVPPAGCRWRQAKFSPFPSFKNNFGVQLAPEDLVIDVDPRNFKEGVNSFEELKKRIGGLPNTFTVKTGSGGFHVYYKKAADAKIKQGIRDLPGIDFLSVAHYVVGGGCTHPVTGLGYGFHNKTPQDIAQAPTALLEALKRSENPISTGSADYVTDEQTRKRFIDYLRKAPAAVEGQAGDRTTFSVAAVAHDLGLHPDVAFELMCIEYNPRCEPPWDPQDLKKKVYNAYQYTESALGNKAGSVAEFPEVTEIDPKDKRWDRTDKGLLKTNHNNMVKVLTAGMGPLGGLLGYNEFVNDIVFIKPAPWHKKGERGGLWTDEEALKCKYWLSHTFKFEPPTVVIHEAAIVAAQWHCFHPVRQYLEGLVWDGHKRAHEWLIKYLEAEDNDYVRAVGLKTLVAGVMRIYEPGCKFDYLMVIEGRQGSGKSRTLAALAAPWFSDQQMDIGNKDAIETMRGKWIIELPEMETHYRSETQAMKAFLSRSTDRVRPAYARVAKDFPRQCIFIGTVNPEADDDIGYLKDTTGNRRYWPVKTGTINLAAICQIRDQLWAEAVHLYKNKIPIYLEDEAIIKRALAEQKERLGRDAWHNQVAHWLEHNEQASTEIVLTGQRIFTDCLGGKLSLYGGREQRRISNIMQELGWTKGVHWNPSSGLSERGYKRPVIK